MISYVVKKQKYKTPSTGEVKEKFSITLTSTSTMFEEEQANRIINMSTLHPAEFKLAIAMYCELARKAMREGRAVQLGDLGYLCPKIKASTVENDKDATAGKTLKKFSYYFRPAVSLSKMLNRLPFRKIVLPKGNKYEYNTEDNTPQTDE